MEPPPSLHVDMPPAVVAILTLLLVALAIALGCMIALPLRSVKKR